VSSLSVLVHCRDKASAKLFSGPGMCCALSCIMSCSITNCASLHATAASTGSVAELMLHLWSQQSAEELSVKASMLPCVGTYCLFDSSTHIPTTAAKNAIELLWMSVIRGKYIRHAAPEGTEYPPIPMGQASLIVMFVGCLVVRRFRLMPALALSSNLVQRRNMLSSTSVKRIVRFRYFELVMWHCRSPR
jgi:hypothetical protein